MYMAKKDAINEDGVATFTPTLQVHTWQVRLTMADNTGGACLIETIDVEGDAVAVKLLASGSSEWISNTTPFKSAELLIDSTCTKLRVTNTDGTAMDVKVMAYRTLEDMPTGAFGTDGLVYVAG
jgi:hypothetical protein